MSKSVIVYGPQGCGKTKNASLLRRKFNLQNVIDGWDVNIKIPREGALVLTNTKPDEKKFKDFTVMSFEKAMSI